jgi:phage terminase large subunit
LQYPRQYVRRVFDSYTGKAEKRFGFKTTSLTRPAILSRLTEVVREHSGLLVDRDTLEELLTIVRNEQGRIEAPAGGHDDLMMALAIAFEIRDQGILPPEPVKTAPKWGIFRDSGEEISVI